jgi:hypothetical protein
VVVIYIGIRLDAAHNLNFFYFSRLKASSYKSASGARGAGCDHLKRISARTEREGIKVGTYIESGRFALVCLDIVNEIRPSQIATTRSQRPD